jgi:hypothetical protein
MTTGYTQSDLDKLNALVTDDAMSQEVEIRLAADELIERFGDQCGALEAESWANAAFDHGDTAKYEFWQWVAMDINERNNQKWRAKKLLS